MSSPRSTKKNTSSIAASASLLMAGSALGADFSSSSNIAVYWGQNSYGQATGPLTQQSLVTYCANTNIDIIPIAFMIQITGGYNTRYNTTFNRYFLPANETARSSEQNEQRMTLNFANAGNNCSIFPGTGLLNCADTIGEDIKTCQQQYGKKILLSIGGATYTEGGFASEAVALDAADTVWHTFGPDPNTNNLTSSTSILRPFGDAVIDGFDFDIEATNTNLVPFARRLRELMDDEESKQYYFTAAPQCPFPDHAVGDLLASDVRMDAVFVQFYNNYCGLQSFVPNATTQWNFNFETWDIWAKSASLRYNSRTTKSKRQSTDDVKVYLGVPAGLGAAGSGYLSPNQLAPVVEYSQQFDSFGGVMMWDASQAAANEGFLTGVRSLLVDDEPITTPEPTAEPTAEPTVEPTTEPTAEPTTESTVEPTTEVTVTTSSDEPTVTAEPTLDITTSSDEPSVTAEPTSDITSETETSSTETSSTETSSTETSSTETSSTETSSTEGSSTSTEEPTTTDEPVTVTQDPITVTEDGLTITQSTTTTTTTTELLPSATTTEEVTSTTTSSEEVSSTTTSEEVSSTTTSEEPSTTTSEEVPSTTTSEEVSSTTTSEEVSSTTTSEEVSSTITSEEASSTTTSEEVSSTTTSEEVSSTIEISTTTLESSAEVSSTTETSTTSTESSSIESTSSSTVAVLPELPTLSSSTESSTTRTILPTVSPTASVTTTTVTADGGDACFDFVGACVVYANGESTTYTGEAPGEQPTLSVTVVDPTFTSPATGLPSATEELPSATSSETFGATELPVVTSELSATVLLTPQTSFDPSTFATVFVASTGEVAPTATPFSPTSTNIEAEAANLAERRSTGLIMRGLNWIFGGM